MSTTLLIVGAGIAGAALAGFCDRLDGVDYRIIEKAEGFDRVEYGIGLWHNGIDVLERLGVARRVRSRGNTRSRFRIRSALGAVATVELPDLDDGHPFVAVHRADLHESLLTTVPDGAIRFGTTPIGIDESGSTVAVELSTGAVEEYDLVVGADGVASAVRNRSFDGSFRRPSGTVAWSFWTALDEFPSLPTTAFGPGTEAFLTEIGGRGLVNVATSASSVPADGDPIERLETVCAEIGWILPEALRRAEGEIFHDRIATVEMDRWIRGRVALIGDAAHAVHPISGMGAVLALEDALVLARQLDDSDDVRRALERYQTARRVPVRSVRRTAAWMQRIMYTDSRVLTAAKHSLLSRPWLLEKTLAWYLHRLG